MFDQILKVQLRKKSIENLNLLKLSFVKSLRSMEKLSKEAVRMVKR